MSFCTVWALVAVSIDSEGAANRSSGVNLNVRIQTLVFLAITIAKVQARWYTVWFGVVRQIA